MGWLSTHWVGLAGGEGLASGHGVGWAGRGGGGVPGRTLIRTAHPALWQERTLHQLLASVPYPWGRCIGHRLVTRSTDPQCRSFPTFDHVAASNATHCLRGPCSGWRARVSKWVSPGCVVSPGAWQAAQPDEGELVAGQSCGPRGGVQGFDRPSVPRIFSLNLQLLTRSILQATGPVSQLIRQPPQHKGTWNNSYINTLPSMLTLPAACTRLQTTFSIELEPQKQWFLKRPKSAKTRGRRVWTSPCSDKRSGGTIWGGVRGTANLARAMAHGRLLREICPAHVETVGEPRAGNYWKKVFSIHFAPIFRPQTAQFQGILAFLEGQTGPPQAHNGR